MKLPLKQLAMAAAISTLALNAAAQDTVGIDFGDDSSLWAQDGECDDPRFEGPGMANSLDDADLMSDASDCRAAYEAGTVTFAAVSPTPKPLLNKMPDRRPTPASTDGDYGDDESIWSNDGECDDARFIGEGMTITGFVESDIGHDASDCRTGVEDGSIRWRGPGDPTVEQALADMDSDISDIFDELDDFDAADPSGYDDPPVDGIMFNGVNFGDNSSEWANDDECDDPRFLGKGMTDTTLLASDAYHDADDCLTAWKAGDLRLSDD